GVSDPARLARLRELLPMLLDFSVFDMWAVWLFPRLLNTALVRRDPSQRVRPEVDRLLYEEIDAHRADPDRHDDILALLISSRDAFPDPEDCRPERFLDGYPPPYTFIPFGGGTRRCIGAAFAVMEMKTVLATVLQHVELAAPDQRPERPRTHHVTQIPSHGAR